MMIPFIPARFRELSFFLCHETTDISSRHRRKIFIFIRDVAAKAQRLFCRSFSVSTNVYYWLLFIPIPILRLPVTKCGRIFLSGGRG